MNLFNAVLYLHIACVVVSVSLFVLRYWWSWSGNRLLDQRWVRIAPHCSDTAVSQRRRINGNNALSAVYRRGYMAD